VIIAIYIDKKVTVVLNSKPQRLQSTRYYIIMFERTTR